MLDMSKAFDTIQRGTLINDLKPIINNDELHLISILIDNVSYNVKLDGQLGTPFTTNIGSPQGDSASALFFITYLANSLKPQGPEMSVIDHTQPLHLIKHDYTNTANNYITIDQQYADDIGWASTGVHLLKAIEEKTTQYLTQRNLTINKDKTEKYSISRITVMTHGESANTLVAC